MIKWLEPLDKKCVEPATPGLWAAPEKRPSFSPRLCLLFAPKCGSGFDPGAGLDVEVVLVSTWYERGRVASSLFPFRGCAIHLGWTNDKKALVQFGVVPSTCCLAATWDNSIRTTLGLLHGQ